MKHRPPSILAPYYLIDGRGWHPYWREEDAYAAAESLAELYGEPECAVIERNPDGTYTVRQGRLDDDDE